MSRYRRRGDAGARDRRSADRRPGEVTLEIQTAYLDTVRGRSERWAHWLEYAAPLPAEA